MDEIEDVTSELGRDDKPENRVYRTPGGSVIKVKTWRVQSAVPSQMPFRMTASICDAGGGALAGWVLDDPRGRRSLTLMLNSPLFTDVETMVEAARRDYVRDVESLYATRTAPLPPGIADAPEIAR